MLILIKCNVLLPWNMNGKEEILNLTPIANLENHFKLPNFGHQKRPHLLDLEYVRKGLFFYNN